MSFKDGDLHVKVDELEKQVEKLKVLNGELCAESNEKDERIRELELRKLYVRHVETCEWRLEHSGTLYDKWRCSKCGYLFVEPRCDQGYNDLDPNFCPSCGRKVVTV